MKKILLFLSAFLLVACNDSSTPGLSTSTPTTTTISGGASGTAAVKITWNTTSTATGYLVEESTDGSSYSQISNIASSITSATITGLQLGSKYYFRIRAYNNGGDSPYSSVVSASL